MHRFRIVLILLIFSLSVREPTCAQEKKGFSIKPYLQNAGTRQMTVMWSSWHPGECTLTYSFQGSIPVTVSVSDPSPVTYPVAWHRKGKPPPKILTEYIYEFQLKDLKPDTAYTYEVACGGEKKGGSFSTWPEAPKPFTFIAYGDSRSGISKHRALAARFISHRPDLILHTGDLVSGSLFAAWKQMIFEPLNDVIDKVPLFTVQGNHDRYKDYYKRVFSLPHNEIWYSFDYANVHFVGVDTNGWRTDDTESIRSQLAWVEKDLAASSAQWKIVFLHEPIFDMGGKHRSEWGRKDFLPLFWKHRVDIVFCGHSHSYQRFRPMFRKDKPDAHLMTHIVVAGGGAELHIVDQHIQLGCGATEFHYMVFQVDGGKMSARAIDREGKEIDSFTMTKKDGGYTRAYRDISFPQNEFNKYGRDILPYLNKICLPKVPARGETLRFDIELGAGPYRMKYILSPAPRVLKDYRVKPVSGVVEANEIARVSLEVTATGRVRGRRRERGKYHLSPKFILECAYEIDGIKGKVCSPDLSASSR